MGLPHVDRSSPPGPGARTTAEGWAAVRRDGIDTLIHVDGSGGYTDVETPYTAWSSLVPAPDGLAAVAASFTDEAAIVAGRPGRPAGDPPAPRPRGLTEAQVSLPESIEFPSADGRTAHALYYPPTNPGHVGPDGEKPPLLVDIHGGPTGAARSQFQLGIQFWTSRGFAVVDVNYGGSTGYGRDTASCSEGQWGVVDVEDCVAAATYLADRGDVDPERLAIRGGSAGGSPRWPPSPSTTRSPPGSASYGVADLAVLAQETHKFESRYLDSPRRAVARGRGRLPRALAALPRRPDSGSRCSCSRGWRTRSSRRTSRELIVDALRAQRHPRDLPGLRGRAARLPQGRDDRRGHRGRAGLLRRGLRLHPGVDRELRRRRWRRRAGRRSRRPRCRRR